MEEVSRPNPQKRNIIIQKLVHAPWWLLVILAGVLAFAISVSDSRTYNDAWEEVQGGVWTTVWVTIVAYGIALVFGLLMALLRLPSKSITYNLLVVQPTSVIVETVRGIPTLVIVFYVTLALVPQIIYLGNDLGTWMQENDVAIFGLADMLVEARPRDVPTVWRAIFALALSYSAFLSEVFRAGIESIPYGQHEAALSLGMSRFQVMRLIVLPQAIRNVLPPLGNDFIAMLKESSLVSIVGVEDITREGQTFAAATFTYFQSYNVVALTYLMLTLTLSVIVKGMEAYLDRGLQRD
jgi:polar amino acid transport system permease protein